MKRLIIPAMAILMPLTASGAFAASVTKEIKSMDTTAHTVTLNDDAVYVFPADYDLSTLKAGEKVEITFEAIDGKNQATEVRSSM